MATGQHYQVVMRGKRLKKDVQRWINYWWKITKTNIVFLGITCSNELYTIGAGTCNKNINMHFDSMLTSNNVLTKPEKKILYSTH